MTALQRFEDWVSGTLEDRLGALLGGRVQPVDLARRLAEAMDDHRTVGAGRTYVPNVYRVYLAPWTLKSFASYQTALQDELAAFLKARAVESDFRFVGRPRVTLLADPELRAERIRVDADLVDAQLANGHGVTRAIDLGEVVAESRPLALRLPGRDRVALTGDQLSLGRSLDNDVIVDDSTVSRHHAHLLRRGHHWLVEDLGSTHGTYLNDHQVTSAVLRMGDRVRLGAVQIRIIPDPDGGT